MSENTLEERRVPGRPFAPGNPGRPKGSGNKFTNDIKAMILAALDEAGGKDYLVRQSTENPIAFMGLLGKILPTQINADVTGTSYVLIGHAEAEDAAAWQQQHGPQTAG